MKHAAILLFAAASAVSASAQVPQENSKILGKLKDVRGFVTVVDGGQLSNAVSGAPLVLGSRIIATSGGGVTVAYENGCNVVLKANQYFSVQENPNCAALVASVGAVEPAVASSSSTGSSSVSNSGLLVSGAATAVAAVLNGRSSGSTGSGVSGVSALGIRPPVNFNSGQ